MQHRVSGIISQFSSVIMLAKCVPSIMELRENDSFQIGKKTKLKSCRQFLTPFTQRQNGSSFRVEKGYVMYKKNENACAKRAKLMFVIVKYANV